MVFKARGYRLCSTAKTRRGEAVRERSSAPDLHPQTLALPQLLTVCGDIDFFRKLSHIHFKPVLDIIENFGIVFVRHKSYGQAFGAKATCAGHLQGGRNRVRPQTHTQGLMTSRARCPRTPLSPWEGNLSLTLWR